MIQTPRVCMAASLVPRSANSSVKYSPATVRNAVDLHGTAIEITSGLHAGDHIVTNPGDMVRPGAIVLPQTAPSVVGEGVPERNTENQRHPGGIGSPSMAAPTGGQPKKGGK